MKQPTIDPQTAILLVEDDARSRKVMRLLLQARLNLAHFTMFEDSGDVVARAEALRPRPQIILLDIHMEPLDGVAVLHQLRASDSFGQVPIIALTASVMNEEVDDLRAQGFDGVIAKPIDVDTFPALLGRALKGETLW